MKKLIYLIVVIAALGLIVSGCIPVVPPTEQNEPGTLPNKASGDVWYVPGDYATIQDAINAATGGETIIVAAGIYSGFVDTKGLDIRGAQYNVDPAGALYRGASDSSEETVIIGPVKITADNASVNGFKMISSSYIEISDAYNSALNVNVSYNILEDTALVEGAIDLNGANRCAEGYIGYNTISGAMGYGIKTLQNDDVTIEYNHVLDSSGFAAIDAGYHSGTGIVIHGNTITNSGGKGINYWAEDGGVITDNVITNSNYEAIYTDAQAIISGNQITGGNMHGILVVAWTGGTAAGSTVSANTISNTFYEGIQAKVPATITGNDISECYHGIQIRNHATGTIIEWNNIHDNNYHGLEIPNYNFTGETPVTGATIINNIFTDNGYTGIKIDNETWGCHIDGSGINIHYNSFEGNVYYGVESFTTTANVDATRNWWGHASGPGGEYGRTNPTGKIIGKGDAVSNYVNWDPWLSQPTVPPTQVLNKWDLESTFVAHSGYNWGGLAEGATWDYSIHIKEAMNGDFSVGSIYFTTGDIEVTGIVEQTKSDYAYWSKSNLAAAGRVEYDGITYNFLFLYSETAIWFAISQADLEPSWSQETVWGGSLRAYQLHSLNPGTTVDWDPKNIH